MRQHLRPLAPSALRLMLVMEHAEPRSATFAPHSYLLHELLRAVKQHLTLSTQCSSSARACTDLTGERCTDGHPIAQLPALPLQTPDTSRIDGHVCHAAMVCQPMDGIAEMLQACAPCLLTQLQRALHAIQDRGKMPRR